jgi:hypothetical protein
MPLYCTHHAEGLVDPKSDEQKTVTAFRYPEHVDSGNMKFKIGRPSSVYLKKVGRWSSDNIS